MDKKEAVMTKKSVLVVIIGLLIVVNLYQYANMSQTKRSFDLYENELRNSKYSADELLVESTTQLNVNLKESTKLNKDIEVYAQIIVELYHNLEFNYLRELYNFNAYFLINNVLVDLPRNGVLYIPGDTFTFQAESTPMPNVGHFQVNDLLQNNMFEPIFQTLYYPSTDDSTESNNKLELTYHLDVGESVQFKLKKVFKESFALENDTITIKRFDPKDYKRGSDYYVKKTMVKVFSFEDTLTYHNYYEVTNDYVVVRQGAPNLDLDVSDDRKIYILNDAVGFMMWYQPILDPIKELDMIVLPSSIFMGYEWSSQYSNQYYLISDLQADIDVLGQTMKCLEISTFHNNRLSVKTYYAEGIGEVKNIYSNNSISELVGLEYLE